MHGLRDSWIGRAVAVALVVVGSVVVFALLGGIRLAHSAIRLDQYVEPVPENTAKPGITGRAVVGEELTASTGTWTGGVDSYSYRWQRCRGAMVCRNVADGAGRTYGVREADVSFSLRVVVRAHNAGGTAAGVASDPSAVVTATASRANQAPRLAFLSLKRVGTLVYSRFRVCDDSSVRVRITERDSRSGVVGQTRQFAVSALPCATYSRHWGLAARFRHGVYRATLQARDREGAMSPKRSLTLHFPAL